MTATAKARKPPAKPPPTPPMSLCTDSDLERFCSLYVEYFNHRHFDILAKGLDHLVAPEFRGDLMSDGVGFSYEDFVARLQNVCQHFPTARYELNDTEITFNKCSDYAEVFVDLNVLGRPEGIRKHAISVLKFRRDGEKWIWFWYKSYAGNRQFLAAT